MKLKRLKDGEEQNPKAPKDMKFDHVPNNGLVNLFTSLDKLIGKKNIYYLCADTHFYEEGIITFNNIKIQQYIVGTGGADPDMLSPEQLYDKDGIKYVKCIPEDKKDIDVNQCSWTSADNIDAKSREEGFLEIVDGENIDIQFFRTGLPEKAYTTNKPVSVQKRKTRKKTKTTQKAMSF